jgi:hypothetical protein
MLMPDVILSVDWSFRSSVSEGLRRRVGCGHIGDGTEVLELVGVDNAGSTVDEDWFEGDPQVVSPHRTGRRRGGDPVASTERLAERACLAVPVPQATASVASMSTNWSNGLASTSADDMVAVLGYNEIGALKDY